MQWDSRSRFTEHFLQSLLSHILTIILLFLGLLRLTFNELLPIEGSMSDQVCVRNNRALTTSPPYGAHVQMTWLSYIVTRERVYV